jgi:excisionase family DNA binding protein
MTAWVRKMIIADDDDNLAWRRSAVAADERPPEGWQILTPAERQQAERAPPLAYSIAQVVAMLGIGRDKLYHEIREKKLIARKAGKRTLILAADLESYLASLPRAGDAQRRLGRGRR